MTPLPPSVARAWLPVALSRDVGARPLARKLAGVRGWGSGGSSASRGWGGVVGVVGVAVEGPACVGLGVVVAAEHHGVVEVGFAAVVVGGEVVGVAPLAGVGAEGPGALGVADAEGAALGGGEVAGAVGVVEDGASGVEDGAGEPGVAGVAAEDVGADGAGVVDLGA